MAAMLNARDRFVTPRRRITYVRADRGRPL